MPICFKCLRNCQFTKAKRIFCSICNMHHNIGKLILSLHDGIENHTSLPNHENPFSDLGENLFDDSTDLELIDIALNQEQHEHDLWLGKIRSILNSTENANQFAIIHLYINSIMSKLSYIEKLLNSNRLDVLVLQETKIDDVIPNNLLRFTNYEMIRRDRTKSGGDILVYFRSIYVVSKLISDQIYETISFNLRASGKSLQFIVSYGINGIIIIVILRRKKIMQVLP
jgi:hypothetical protein